MPRLAAFFRDAEWLTAERARAWAAVLIVLVLGATALLIAATEALMTLGQRPIGTDFVSFWTASQLALEGRPEAAWDRAAHEAAQRALLPAMQPGWYAFFYPPVFLLLCLPLALLPYPAALAAWLLGGAAAWAAAVAALVGRRWAWIAILGCPAAYLSAAHGQNGLLSAALFGAAALALERRPVLAGVCIGALCFKPQLGLLAPLALAAAGRWRAFGAAAATVLALSALAALVLGGGSWAAFLGSNAAARQTLEAGTVGHEKLVSVFAALRLLGIGIAPSYAAQAAAALAAAALLVLALRRRPGGRLEVAALAAAVPLASPFLLDYDLVVLTVPLAVVAAEAQRTGWWPWEKLVLLLAFTLPLATRALAGTLGLPLMPLVAAALLAVVLRRAALARRDEARGLHRTS
jgi:hypothetical protein